MISGEAQEKLRVDFFAAGTDFLAVLDEEDFLAGFRTFSTNRLFGFTGTNDKPAALWTSTGSSEDLPEAERWRQIKGPAARTATHGHYNLIGSIRRSQGNPHAGIQERSEWWDKRIRYTRNTSPFLSFSAKRRVSQTAKTCWPGSG